MEGTTAAAVPGVEPDADLVSGLGSTGYSAAGNRNLVRGTRQRHSSARDWSRGLRDEVTDPGDEDDTGEGDDTETEVEAPGEDVSAEPEETGGAPDSDEAGDAEDLHVGV